MINGRFYFRLTDSGNLVGEFSNQESNVNSSESADVQLNLESMQLGDLTVFTGNYISTWRERGDSEFMSLSIIPIVRTANLFSLTWSINETPTFFGEGFVMNGVLIGNYWDNQLNVELRRLDCLRRIDENI